MSNKAMGLKAQIRNLAKTKNVMAQILLQNYVFERFLERLSLSAYKDSFILKGGMLISAIVGIDSRTTMDLDATVRGLALTEESILKAVSAICGIFVDDGVTMTVGGVTSIRADDEYGGYRTKIKHATQSYQPVLLKEAFTATATHRHTGEQVSDIPAILDAIEGSAALRQMWEKYRQEFSYATDLTYGVVVASLKAVCVAISQ